MTAFASRAARDLAIELGLDDVAIIGTGRGGRVTLDDVRSAAPSTPAGLGDAGLAFWRDVHRDWELRADQERLLLAACRTLDEIARLEEALSSSETVVPGSKGQVRAHPLVRELRDHRLAFQRLIGADGIGLTDDEADESRSRSTAGRQLAGARWSKHRG